MTDEEILLAAIHANPNDAAAGFAYADWLQENGFDDKAEFVRMEYQYRRAKARKHELRNVLENEWINEFLGFWYVVLLRYPRERKITVLNIICSYTNAGLEKAKAMSEDLPSVITPPMFPERAEEVLLQLRDIGAEAELRFASPE